MTRRTPPCPPEVRERAARTVPGHRGGHGSRYAAIRSVAAKLGRSGETPRDWVRRAERGQGLRDALERALRKRRPARGGGALVENGHRVLFTRTTDLVQRLQAARRALQLEAAVAKLDRYDLLVPDDLSYVRRDQAETSVLFELIASRYERRGLLVTANHPFGAWETQFPDKSMTVAAIDRLAHHATVLEMNVESYRRRAATTHQPAKGVLRRDTTRDSSATQEDATASCRCRQSAPS